MAIHELTLDKLQHFTLLATTTITATGDQTGVDLAGYEGDVQIILSGTAAGADADLTFRIEESDASGGTCSGARQDDLDIAFVAGQVDAGLIASGGDGGRGQEGEVLEFVQRELMNRHCF